MTVEQQVTEEEIQTAYRGEEVAENYVDRRFETELTRLLHDKQVAVIQKQIDAVQPQRVLEIAPGPGRLTRCIRAPGEHVAVEFNSGMIKTGKAATPEKVRWIQGNGFALPFDAAAFDLAYTFRFIRHFKLEDRQRLYAQVREVLQPGGWFVMDAVNGIVSRPQREASPDKYPIYDELYDSVDELRTEMSEAGFELTDAVEVQKCLRLQYKSQIYIGPRWNWLNRALIRLLERLGSGPALEWIITCRRV